MRILLIIMITLTVIRKRDDHIEVTDIIKITMITLSLTTMDGKSINVRTDVLLIITGGSNHLMLIKTIEKNHITYQFTTKVQYYFL